MKLSDSIKREKEKVSLSLEYFGLDKCKDDKERVIKLVGDIEKKKNELKQVKKKYNEILGNIFDLWKKEIETSFPSLPIHTHSSKGGDIITMFAYNDVHYEAVLGRPVGKSKFICMVRVKLEDFSNDKHLDKDIVSEFKEILPLDYLNLNYALFKEFDIIKLDDTISCYFELINRFEKLIKCPKTK